MRAIRLIAYGTTAGAGSAWKRARANGRYSRKPDTRKNTGTPASSWATYGARAPWDAPLTSQTW